MFARMRVSLLAAVGCLCLAVQARAFVAPGSRSSGAPYLKRHNVKVQINGHIATTRVEQVFHNPRSRGMEGEFIFPIPENAAISNFTLDIDGKSVHSISA